MEILFIQKFIKIEVIYISLLILLVRKKKKISIYVDQIESAWKKSLCPL